MKSEEFKRLLRHGLGRAVLYGQAHGLLAYREDLWAACVENPAFDRQMEGERSEFLFDLISCSGEPEWYRKASIDLLNGREDPDEQIYEIVRRFAAQGDSESRKALYGAFDRNLPGSDLNGFSIIRLDGSAGYRHVIEIIGGTEKPREDAWVRGLLHDDSIAVLGKERALEVLEGAAAEGPQGRGFLEAVRWERPKPRPRSQDIEGLPFVSIADEVGRHGFATMRTWARTATDADLEMAAVMLDAEQEPHRITALLGVFLARPYPGRLDRLITLGDHADYRISQRAFGAIAQIEREDARAYALECIRLGRGHMGLIETLMRNHALGDEAYVRQVIQALVEEDDIHHGQFELVDFVKAYPNLELEIEGLVWFYERNPCTSMCREEQVRRLVKLNALPDWMSAECRWDANPEVRKLVTEVIK